jgi:predicted small secreted protein
MTKAMVLLFALTLITSSLVACNTVHGVGQDVEKAGEAIKKSTQ